MTWVLIIAGAWVAVAAVTALVIGRTVHTADVLEHTDEAAGPRADDVPPTASSLPLPRTAVAER